jgi:hypothetical protein
MANQFIIRRTTAEWAADNPVLLANQLGVESNIVDNVETDDLLAKLGNGVDNWNDLPYWPPGIDGDVQGPASATDNAATVFDGTTGKTVKDGSAVNVLQKRAVESFTTTATAAGTTTLTVASNPIQEFTGVTTQTVVLPVVTTLPKTGFQFVIINNSTGALTVNSSGANLVQTIVAGGSAVITCVLLTGTTAASWDVAYSDSMAGGTAGSVVFLGANGALAQNNAGFFYDDATNQLQLNSLATTEVPLKLAMFAGQTADAIQVYDSLGTTKLFSVDKQGNVRIISPAYSTYVSITDANGKRLLFDSDALLFGIGNDMHFKWINTATQVPDIGLYRHAASVLAVTDGSGSPTPGVRGLLGGGAAVASAAAMPVPTGGVFHVTGTTNITSITSTNLQAGVTITLIFDDVLTFTDGNNLKLAGNFVTTTDDTITLAYDGSNWFEVCRSVN